MWLEAWLDLPQPKLSLLNRLGSAMAELSQRKRKQYERSNDNAIKRTEEVVTDDFADFLYA
ncbi:hypothetical protein [Undibacterium sp.]|uniref:hypothetical protein n=1 Tax=Undibacterium sp. TaxID=1914977 RepID=UPI0025E1D109|nr:hypothetical protein [Undibacterium sp.]